MPYIWEVICIRTDDYGNGTVITYPRELYWCKNPGQGGLYYGLGAGGCIVYNPAGTPTSTSEPTGTQGASPGLDTITGSGNDSKVLGNVFAVTTDNPPVSDSIKNKSIDKGQLKQLIPTVPQESETTSEGDSGNNGEAGNDEKDETNNKDKEETNNVPNSNDSPE